MMFQAAWFAPSLTAAAALLWAAALSVCAPAALRSVRRFPQAAGAAFCLLVLLWHLRADVPGGQLAGLSFHLLGVCLAALMAGPAAALWLGSAVVLLTVAGAGGTVWQTAGLTAVLLLLPPLAVGTLIRRAGERLMPPNLFVYIFVYAFLAPAAAMLVCGALCTALLAYSSTGAFDGVPLWHSAFPVFFLLAWGEAFLSGLLTAVLVALRPQYLATFDDARYLQPRNRIWLPEE